MVISPPFVSFHLSFHVSGGAEHHDEPHQTSGSKWLPAAICGFNQLIVRGFDEKSCLGDTILSEFHLSHAEFSRVETQVGSPKFTTSAYGDLPDSRGSVSVPGAPSPTVQP